MDLPLLSRQGPKPALDIYVNSVSAKTVNVETNLQANTLLYVPQPLNSDWTLGATNAFTFPIYIASSGTYVNMSANAQVSWSSNEGKTVQSATSNIAFNNAAGGVIGYSAVAGYAVFYSSLQYGISVDGRTWTLTNKANVVPVTFDSYWPVQYNEFYNKWVWCGDSQMVTADPTTWGTFGVTTRGPSTAKAFCLAIDQKTGNMVTVSSTSPTLYSLDGGKTWLTANQALTGYIITYVAPWNRFIAILNGNYCTSIDGKVWVNTVFASMGLSIFAGTPLNLVYVPELKLLLLGLHKTGTNIPSIAYQSSLDGQFKSTPLTGGAATNAEIMGLTYFPSTGRLTVTYYTSQVYYSALADTLIIPYPVRFINYTPIIQMVGPEEVEEDDEEYEE